MVKINLNAQVEVELTPLGLEILHKEFEEVVKNSVILKDVTFEKAYDIRKGRWSTVLWKVMQVFGEYMGMGRTEYPIKDLTLFVRDKDIKLTNKGAENERQM